MLVLFKRKYCQKCPYLTVFEPLEEDPNPRLLVLQQLGNRRLWIFALEDCRWISMYFYFGACAASAKGQRSAKQNATLLQCTTISTIWKHFILFTLFTFQPSCMIFRTYVFKEVFSSHLYLSRLMKGQSKILADQGNAWIFASTLLLDLFALPSFDVTIFTPSIFSVCVKPSTPLITSRLERQEGSESQRAAEMMG